MSRAVKRVDMALNGSYRKVVLDDAPTAWYRFAEQTGSTVAKDVSGNAYHGAFAGGVLLEEPPFIPDSGRSAKFDGVDDRITVAGIPATGTTFSIETWIKPNTPSGAGAILSDTAGTVYFGLDSARKLNMFFTGTSHLSTAALADLGWSHVVVVVTAGAGTFYINGAASGTFTSCPTFTPSRVGRYDTAAPLKAWLNELVLFPTALSLGQLFAHYLAGTWTDVTADVLLIEPCTMKWGIDGNGPKDRIASMGVASFTFDNSEANSVHLRGRYSPHHVNCLAGFDRGVLTRITYRYSSQDFARYTGKIASIAPEFGRYASRRSRVIVHDIVDDLIEADLRNVLLQEDKNEAQLIETLLDAIPLTAQPLALDLDTGLDTCPFAFDTLGSGQKAIQPLTDLSISSIGFLHVGPTGILRYENRQARPFVASSLTIDNDIVGLEVPSTSEGLFNHIRVTYHPKTKDAAATTVLWAQTGDPPALLTGETREFFGDYYRTDDQKVKIGGTAFVALAAFPAGTNDYRANTVADNSGTDKTANVTVTAVPFASTVKFTVTNNDAGTVFLTKLQIRGKGLYDYAPQTVESMSKQAYGDHAIDIDMLYQSDYNVAAGLGDYILAQYENIEGQAQSLTLFPQQSDAHMLYALQVQVGYRITVSEEMTGLVLDDLFVQSVELTEVEGLIVSCKLGLSATTFFDQVWVLDDAVLSLLGNDATHAGSTYLGYA